MTETQLIEKALFELYDSKRAKASARFFKTGKGEYGEGDVFWGLTMPQTRQVARKYSHLTLKDLQRLLSSQIHEHRMAVVLILVQQFQKAKKNQKKQFVDFYLKNTRRFNNWDLVDLSAPKILGPWFLNKDRRALYLLAKSKNLWERRIAIMATFEFIRNNQFDDTLKISEILLEDEHNLIHKAVGWMLREVGKKDQKVEENFLKKHHRKMPRTMLRYAIERFGEKKRQFYLKK